MLNKKKREKNGHVLWIVCNTVQYFCCRKVLLIIRVWLEPPPSLRVEPADANDALAVLGKHLWLIRASAQSQGEEWWSTSKYSLAKLRCPQTQQVHRATSLWLVIKRSMPVWKITAGFVNNTKHRVTCHISRLCNATPTWLWPVFSWTLWHKLSLWRWFYLVLHLLVINNNKTKVTLPSGPTLIGTFAVSKDGSIR